MLIYFLCYIYIFNLSTTKHCLLFSYKVNIYSFNSDKNSRLSKVESYLLGIANYKHIARCPSMVQH